MLKQTFKDQMDFNFYLIEQKKRKDNGYLTVSERKQLELMLNKDYKPNFIQEKIKLPIVTNIQELKKPCDLVTKDDNIKEIVQKLKNTLEGYNGYGLAANQIGISKRISYLKIPKLVNKKIEYQELILINPKITEASRLMINKREGCLSFSGLPIDTDRYTFITIINHNEKLEPQIVSFHALEAFIIQHEIDHLLGITIFDRKHRAYRSKL